MDCQSCLGSGLLEEWGRVKRLLSAAGIDTRQLVGVDFHADSRSEVNEEMLPCCSGH